MKKAVFLDRDGTINVEKNYLYRIDDFEYLEGVKNALKIFQDLGYELVVLSNQSGIARGYYTESDYRILSEWLKMDLEKSDIYITDQYYCPHLPGASIKTYSINCACRKPKIGMFLQAAEEHNLDLDGSIAVGDKMRDLSICNTDIGKKMQGYLLYSDKECSMGNVTLIKGGLLEVAQRIQRENE